MSAQPRSSSKRLINPRDRIPLSIAAAVLVYFLLLLPDPYGNIRLLLAYVGGGVIDLTLLFIMIYSSSAEATMRRSRRAEPSNTSLLVAILFLSGISLVAIALMLNNSHNRSAIAANVDMGLSLVAIFLSWLFVHTYFALHCARIYYDEAPPEAGKLGDEENLGKSPEEYQEEYKVQLKFWLSWFLL